MSQPMNSTVFHASTWFMRRIHRLQHLRSRLQATPFQLLHQVAHATTPTQLNRAVNRFQKLVSKLTVREQRPLRDRLSLTLTEQVNEAAQEQVRIEAAKWLRLLLQAGMITRPDKILVTLVTAATQASADKPASKQEPCSYLRIIADCFCAFHYPYPAFSWEMFPDSSIFYPLAPLLTKANTPMQGQILTIFTELPNLDAPEISEYLLPVALTWATHDDPEQRQQAAHVLARMTHESAQQTLRQLCEESNALVRTGAKHAAGYVRRG